MIRALKKMDILGLNALSPKDWNFDYEDFLQGFVDDDFFYAFVMEQDGGIVGTGNIFLKGKIGWLANIIVSDSYRGRGLGAAMTKYLISFLGQKGCETQLLIATELGESVYQKQGFEKISTYHSFETEVAYGFNSSNSIRELNNSYFRQICELDQYVNGEDRAHLLERFYRHGQGYFSNENELLGFYLPNFGRGLILSGNREAGTELLRLKHAKKGKRSLLPIDNELGIDFLEQMNLKIGDKCSKMILGKALDWKPEYMYSYGSGCFG